MTSVPFRIRGLHPLNKVTVLQIVPGLEVTASARAAIDIAAALSAAGARALVACTEKLRGELQAKGGIFVPFPSRSKNPLTMALGVRRLAQVIAEERADIVHVRSRAMGWVAYGATRLTKTPFVTSFGSGYEASNPIALRYNSVLARGDLVLAESSYAAGIAAKCYSLAANKIRTIRQGLDSRVFSPAAVAPARVEKVRRLWKAAQHEQIVLMPAPVFPCGGHETLVKAAGLLLRSGLTSVKFILAGNSGEASALNREIDRAIAREGLQGIMYRATLSDMPAALLAASIVALPSASARGFGDCAVQAQAMGTPVVAANLGAAPEIILAPPLVAESLRTGFLVPPGDGAALAVAIASALTLGATAGSKLSWRAAKHAETSFSAERMCAETLNAYADVRRGGEA